MIVYRIANAKYKDSVLSGMGAEKVGGRWNEVGIRAVYCSESIALALLEFYVHSENIANLPKSILVAKIEFPDSFEVRDVDPLPKGWDDHPYSGGSASVFTKVAQDRNAFALRVPSAIIGLESNIILNPLYKDFGKVEVLEFIELPVDPRLKKDKRS